ncbi:MAG TPA: hypothetical protein VL403_12520, partial [Candidatus Kryptonia bacterium]|nr:hypothetical protein [Candidatus Kryptonia bacterium]
SFDNTNVIPDGGLYTCQFTIAADASGATALESIRVEASTPDGQALPAQGFSGRIEVLPQSGQ